MYSAAVSSPVHETAAYKECFQLLAFQSRDELQNKLQQVLDILKPSELPEVHQKISDYYKRINDIGSEKQDGSFKSPTKLDLGENINRFQLKEVIHSQVYGNIWWTQNKRK